MYKLLSLSSVSLPTARELLNRWSSYQTESLDENVKYDLHRTHLNNANKLLASWLLFPVGFPQVPRGGAQDSNACCYIVLRSKTVNTSSAPQPNRKRHLLSVTSFQGFNTDATCSNQTQTLPETGHAVRLGQEGWFVIGTRDGSSTSHVNTETDLAHRFLLALRTPCPATDTTK